MLPLFSSRRQRFADEPFGLSELFRRQAPRNLVTRMLLPLAGEEPLLKG